MSTEQMPLEALSLGTPLAEYPGPGMMQAIEGPTLLGALLLAGVGVLRLYYNSTDSATFLLIAGAFVFALWVSRVRHSLPKRDLRVRVFQDGLTYTRAGRTKAFRWDDISTMWRQTVDHYENRYGFIRHKGTAYIYYLLNVSDDEIMLSSAELNQFPRLAETLEKEVTARLAARALKELTDGLEVSFGDFDLSKRGISMDEAMLLWEEVEEVGFAPDQIIIRKRGQSKPWHAVRFSDTPNGPVLAALVPAIGSLRKQQETI